MLSCTKKNILLLILFCVPALFFLINPSKFPADDGFFYPQIAYNIVHGKGSYFNDIYLTNGYHPLWMLFCIIAEFINPFSKQDVVYILWGFQIILAILSLKNIDHFFENNFLSKAFGYFIICLIFFSFGTYYLIEAHLNLYFLSLLLFFLSKNKTNDWMFGVICSLVCLTRLDNIFIVFSLGVFYLIRKNWSIKTLVKSGFIFLIICGIYVYSNYFWFGNMVPISGRIKSSFPNFNPSITLSFLSKFSLITSLIALLFYILYRKTNYRTLKILFVLGTLFQLLYTIGFQGQIGQWYYIAPIMIFVLLSSDLFNSIFKKISHNHLVTYLIISLLFITTTTVSFLKATSNFSLQHTILDSNSKLNQEENYTIKDFAETIKISTPKHAKIFTYDFPGKLAFYSDLNIIPADGLVGNETFFNDISNLPFKEFLKKNNIQYINLPAHFTSKDKSVNFVALNVNIENNKQPNFFIKNTLNKKIVNQIDLTDFEKIKSYKNPIKTWQKDYDSVTIYKIK